MKIRTRKRRMRSPSQWFGHPLDSNGRPKRWQTQDMTRDLPTMKMLPRCLLRRTTLRIRNQIADSLCRCCSSLICLGGLLSFDLSMVSLLHLSIPVATSLSVRRHWEVLRESKDKDHAVAAASSSLALAPVTLQPAAPVANFYFGTSPYRRTLSSPRSLPSLEGPS